MGHYIQGNKASAFTKIHWTLNATTKECKKKKKIGHYIQLNKASVLIKIHWTLNATTKECKTKIRWDTIFNETRQVFSSRYIGLWMLQPRGVKQKKDGTLFMKKRQELSPRYIGLWMLQRRSVRQKQDVTLYSGKQGKCFLQDTLEFECYNRGV